MNRNDLKEYGYQEIFIKSRIEYLKEYREKIENISSIISGMPKRRKSYRG